MSYTGLPFIMDRLVLGPPKLGIMCGADVYVEGRGVCTVVRSAFAEPHERLLKQQGSGEPFKVPLEACQLYLNDSKAIPYAVSAVISAMNTTSAEPLGERALASMESVVKTHSSRHSPIGYTVGRYWFALDVGSSFVPFPDIHTMGATRFAYVAGVCGRVSTYAVPNLNLTDERFALAQILTLISEKFPDKRPEVSLL